MKRISLLFFIRKSKKVSNGTVPIYVRITIAEMRVELATKRYINPEKWNAGAQKVSGSSEEVKNINAYLKSLEHDIYAKHQTLAQQQDVVTVEDLKRELTRKKENSNLLLEVFREHNEKIKTLVGQEYAPATLQRYQTSLKHTVDFLTWKYKVNDINILEIDHDFVSSYDFYLRSIRKCANNSAVKYLKNFKKVIRIGIANGWLTRDPFVNFKSTIKEVKRQFLTDLELDAIANKKFEMDRLSQVRDIFLFSCFTGLAYADIKKLKRSEVSLGVDGEKWIFTSRQKTGTFTRIPLSSGCSGDHQAVL